MGILKTQIKTTLMTPWCQNYNFWVSVVVSGPQKFRRPIFSSGLGRLFQSKRISIYYFMKCKPASKPLLRITRTVEGPPPSPQPVTCALMDTQS